MNGRRQRQPAMRRRPQKIRRKSAPPSQKSPSIMSLFKNVKLKNLPGHLHNIANGMDTFGQISEVMNAFGNSGGGVGKSLNLKKLLTDQNSLNHLVQAFLPILQGAGISEESQGDPIKVEPIETIRTKGHQD